MTIINLTPEKDIIDVASSVTPVSIIGDSATYNASDSITGNDLTTLKLSLDDTATAGSPTVDGVGDVEVTLEGDVTLNAAKYSNVGEVTLEGGGIAGSTLTIDNAPRSTVYAIDAPHAQYDLDINFAHPDGVAQLALDGSGVMGVEADNIGLTNATLDTSIDVVGRNNFDAIALGGHNTSVVVSGVGIANLELSGLAASFTLDASTSSGADTFQFVSGALNNSDAIIGGTGKDTVVADGLSGPDVQLNLTDIDKLVTSFTGDVTFSGTHIAGLHTIVETEISGGAASFADMTNDFANLTIKGDVGAVSVAYGETAPAPHLSVTYATGADSTPQPFDGLEVQNVVDVNVNFKADVDMTGAVGAVTLDNLETTAITLNSAGGYDAYVYLASDAAVTNLTVKATTLGSTMELVNNGPTFYAFSSTHDVNAISILASGQNSDARIASTWSGDILVGGHLGSLTITASGEHATAGASATYDDGPFAAALYAENGIGSVAITASGVSSDAYIAGERAIYATGDIGSVTVTASATNSHAQIYSDAVDSAAVEAYGGNIGTVTVTASGDKAEADIAMTSDGAAVVAYTAHGSTASGNVGPVTVLASGANSDAHISGGEYGIYADNTIGALSVTASGQHASAAIDGFFGVYADGANPLDGTAIGDVTVTASCVLSHAAITGYDAVYADNGSVGVVQVVASGASSHAEISGAEYGIYADGSIGVGLTAPVAHGPIGATVAAGVEITASVAQASAEINGGDYAIYASGDIGPVTLTASGHGSEAGVNPAYTGTWAGYVGEYGVFAADGSIGAITLKASGVSSDAHIAAYSGTAVYGHDGIASLTITASGANSKAYIASGGSSAVSSPGPIGNLDITASGSYADAGVVAIAGTAIRSDSGSIGTLALTASGAHSEAYIFGGGEDNDGVDAHSTLGAVTVTASGAHSLASIDSTLDTAIYVGGTADHVVLPSVTLTASALDAHAEVTGDSNGLYVGEGDVGQITLTASGNGSASSSADHAYAVINGDAGVYVDDGGIGSVTLTASGTYAEAGIDGGGYSGYGLYADTDITHIGVTASGAHSTAYIDGHDGLWVEDGGVSTLAITASGLDSNAYIGNTSDGYSYVDGNVGHINVTADGVGSHASLDWLEVDGSVAQVNVLASAAGSEAYAGISMDTNVVTAVTVTTGTAAHAEYEQEDGMFGTITVATGAAGLGGAGAGGVELNFDGLAAQTVDFNVPGGVINASGGQDLSIDLYDDSASFGALNAGTMTGNVSVDVEYGLRRSGHDDHHRQRQRLRGGGDRVQHPQPRSRPQYLRLLQFRWRWRPTRGRRQRYDQRLDGQRHHCPQDRLDRRARRHVARGLFDGVRHRPLRHIAPACGV